MENIFLQEILERVKDSDLDGFKKKITKMEEEQESRVHSEGLQTADDLVKEKYLKQIRQIEDVEALYVDATALVENTPVQGEGQPLEKNSDTMYDEFLKKLKG